MAKLKNKIIAILLIVLSLGFLAFPTQTHASNNIAVTPYWSALASHGSANTLNGSTGKISISADTYTSKYTLVIWATLQRQNANGTWSDVTSWNATGSRGAVGLAQTYTAAKGSTYRATYSVYVYDANKLIESASGTTNTIKR